MISKNVNIKLSNRANILSSNLHAFYQGLDSRSRNLIKELVSYFKFQFKFLMQFNYTKSNIKNHLMQKATLFFGFDFNEGDKPKGRKRVERKKKLLKSRLNEQLSHAEKEPNRRGLRKRSINFYRAPE